MNKDVKKDVKKDGCEEGRKEGREKGIREGREEEKLAQQRAIAFQAQQMGLDESAIATLIGVPEVVVREMLALSQDHNDS